MLFEEEDAPLLKKWIVKRLENTSDADADVLADYVLALLRHDGDDETVRALCEAEIPDFLKEDSAMFVRDVFDAINYKTYLPGANPPRNPNLPFDPPSGPSALQYMKFGVGPLTGALGGSKKRSYHDRGNGPPQDKGFLYNAYMNDSNKQQRRSGSYMGRGGFDGGRGRLDTGRGGYTGARPVSRNIHPIYSQYSEMPEIPNTSSGMPPFDPNDPMTTMLAMQALGFPISEIPPFTQTGLSSTQGSPMQPSKPRCKDYDTKGFCARGNTCNFEHGEHSIWLPQCETSAEEYDPTKSIMTAIDPNGSNLRNTIEGGIDRELPQAEFEGKERGDRARKGENRHSTHSNKRGGRSEFSSDRPNYDKSKTTIVVENIPEERFSEDEVQEFFSQFGNIVEISLRGYKRLATVKYDDWNSANAAHKSPKVIFDNRFVKVYWFNDPESLPKPPNPSALNSALTNVTSTQGAHAPATETSEPAIDIEEFTRKQQEAQKVHMVKQKKKMEMQATMKELERRQEDLLKCQAEEKRKLMEKIAAKSGKSDPAEKSKTDPSASIDKAPSQTEILKAQLAALEIEAQSLGIDTTYSETKVWSSRGQGRGRGEQRGRGYNPRGFRGGYRGRGAAPFATQFSTVNRSFNLDNRPRKIGITGIDFTDAEKDENLRQYLLGIGEYEEIEVSPTRTCITFKDRRTAEKFMFGTTGNEIPSVGKVEMAWVQTSLPPVSIAAKVVSQKTSTEEDSNMEDGDATVPTRSSGNGAPFKQPEQQNTNANMDYDVAYENEWEPE